MFHPERILYVFRPTSIITRVILILCWIIWTIIEMYYGYRRVEYLLTATIHTILCLIVLSLAVYAKAELKAE